MDIPEFMLMEVLTGSSAVRVEQAARNTVDNNENNNQRKWGRIMCLSLNYELTTNSHQ
jgi:hypothetical protein